MRFYALSHGDIKVDGMPIRNFNLSAYRHNIGIVPQEVILFGGTIQENIAYGKPGASVEEIREAARKANALEFIESFPDKFSTVVGERGVKAVGRTTTTYCYRPGYPEKPRDPHPRRSHQLAGRPLGSAGTGSPRKTDGRPHVDHYRPPAQHH